MKDKRSIILVTGSSGLIGSEVCIHFANRGWKIHGLDNNQRAVFFGPVGDTRWNEERLKSVIRDFHHHELDVRDREGVNKLIESIKPSAIVHCAAQPSHDRAADIPFDDFDTNAVGTLNLLQACKVHCPEAPFVHLSTNKVYGDRPNNIALKELPTRWEFADPNYANGIPETLSIDHSKHSLFGASKVAADILVQEYGKYFGMHTCCLRGGCLTGPNHSGVELHGFLSYLVKCNIEQNHYTVFGYKGKQLRDNIHSYDVATFIESFIESPRIGEVYNIGGGKENTCSVIEAFEMVSAITNKKMSYSITDKPREGDHICYYSDLSKAKLHYPRWSITKSIETIIEEIVVAWKDRPTQSSVGSISRQANQFSIDIQK
ncbi:MAG: NAD-dependent epimerase/dehydratase family protein [Bdellovibrionales bacterium]|nr:NAD-dependent epimerase/dehydratase family protein [Bdellovibrionales bacterium]